LQERRRNQIAFSPDQGDEYVFSYEAYGLGISSALPLPELAVKEVTTDVVVHFGKVDSGPLRAINASHAFWATSDEAYYVFERAGKFLVRSGYEILIDPLPDADERILRLSLLGPALGLILLQRGHCVLHASAVAVAGEAVAFLGGHGWGKSTLAAALHARGHDMITDDVTAICLDMDYPMVRPSFPQFKLWPESLRMLGESLDALPLLHPDFEKRVKHVLGGVAQTAQPLKCLYVLAKEPSVAITPLCPQEALLELMRHSYGTRFGPQFLQVIGIEAYFLQCTSLVKQIRICRLKRPPGFSALSEVARLVEEDLAHAALP
jgi:hypothetical protein